MTEFELAVESVKSALSSTYQLSVVSAAVLVGAGVSVWGRAFGENALGVDGAKFFGAGVGFMLATVALGALVAGALLNELAVAQSSERVPSIERPRVAWLATAQLFSFLAGLGSLGASVFQVVR